MPGERPGDNHVAQEVSNAIVAWFKERAGRGPTHTKAYLADDHVLVLLRNVQTTVERTLVEHGQSELVDQLRRTIRDAYRDELCALVSAKVGRPVATLLSDHDPSADTSALVFLLEREDNRPDGTKPSPP
jgi:uncharacterized protein YbcI